MLQHAFKTVIGGKLRRLLARHVTPVGQSAQRFKGRSCAQALIRPAVHQLQHLHGELHVTQTAPAQLDLPVLKRRRDQVLHTLTHLLTVIDEVIPLGCRPDERSGHIHISLPESPVAGNGPGLEQGLELPALRPLLVIALMGFDRTHQRPVLAFGAQSAIDLPQGRGRNAHDHRLAYALQRGAHLGADADQLLISDGIVGRLHGIDQVDVGHVVQLLRAKLAHADDDEAHMVAAFDLMACNGQCPFQCAVGEIGKFAADGGLDDAGVWRGGVLRHDRRKMTVVGSAQRRGGIGKFKAGHRCVQLVGVRPDGLQHGCASLRMVVQIRVVGVG